MPYKSIADLPNVVISALPSHAQEIFLKAFNNAWEEYQHPKKRKTDSSREEIAFKVAWAAVKKKYRKNSSGEWVDR